MITIDIDLAKVPTHMLSAVGLLKLIRIMTDADIEQAKQIWTAAEASDSRRLVLSAKLVDFRREELYTTLRMSALSYRMIDTGEDYAANHFL
jgi:hypothetical protein